MPRVSLASGFQAAVDGAVSVEIEAATIRELVRRLQEQYPKMTRHFDEGVAVSINGEIYRDIRDLNIPPDAEVFLLPRLQGG